MKAEVLAPNKGNGNRDFTFEAQVKRVHIYPTGYPEFNTSWLSVVEGEGGKIRIIWHGKFVGEVKTVYQLNEGQTVPFEDSPVCNKKSTDGEKK